ncbi:MAG: DUF2905 domain-containing protein [Bacillota bacterium]
MNGLEGMGRMLITIGVFLLVTGGLLVWGGHLAGLGRLPGDILVRRGNFTFYFPVVTMLVISAILTLVFNLLRR